MSSELLSPVEETEDMSQKVTASAPAGHTIQGGIVSLRSPRDLMSLRICFVPIVLFTYVSLVSGIVGVQ